MNKCNLESLVLKHSEEISELKSISGQMMLLWQIVGTVALVVLGAWLAGQFGGGV